MDACVGCHSGADIDADGRGINQLDVCNAVSIDCVDVGRQCGTMDFRLQSGDQAFQYHGGFSGAGYPGDNREPSLGNIDHQGLYRMNLIRRKVNRAIRKQAFFLGTGTQPAPGGTGKKRTDLGSRILFNRRNVALCNDMTALCAGLRSHFDDPVGLLQNLCIMIDQNDGVSICDEIVHHTGKPHNIGGMQTDGGFVQYIENAGGAVADGTGKLHPLALSGGECGCRTVKRQIAKA